MTARQNHILRVLSSIAVGAIAFCVTLPLVLILGAVLLFPFLPMESAAFFPPEFVVLFLTSTLVGIIVARFVGIQYYRYLGKRRT
jgi:hypothetical protein